MNKQRLRLITQGLSPARWRYTCLCTHMQQPQQQQQLQQQQQQQQLQQQQQQQFTFNDYYYPQVTLPPPPRCSIVWDTPDREHVLLSKERLDQLLLAEITEFALRPSRPLTLEQIAFLNQSQQQQYQQQQQQLQQQQEEEEEEERHEEERHDDEEQQQQHAEEDERRDSSSSSSAAAAASASAAAPAPGTRSPGTSGISSNSRTSSSSSSSSRSCPTNASCRAVLAADELGKEGSYKNKGTKRGPPPFGYEPDLFSGPPGPLGPQGGHQGGPQGAPGAPLQSISFGEFLHHELPVRFASRVKQLEALPLFHTEPLVMHVRGAMWVCDGCAPLQLVILSSLATILSLQTLSVSVIPTMGAAHRLKYGTLTGHTLRLSHSICIIFYRSY
ncbi:hypothetical protein, conserved [Eimeria maxima]|uniref:Uncharacterized protein n=1 Tax=Eimeria maxima TaxID=5804 RepID=U6M3I3_EIMMA|nr:hypothetical protein, conserved [Eimeria maxima]CDJ58551.1 hypothetical protein, conserved [Eimeria maxima]